MHRLGFHHEHVHAECVELVVHLAAGVIEQYRHQVVVGRVDVRPLAAVGLQPRLELRPLVWGRKFEQALCATGKVTVHHLVRIRSQVMKDSRAQALTVRHLDVVRSVGLRTLQRLTVASGLGKAIAAETPAVT